MRVYQVEDIQAQDMDKIENKLTDLGLRGAIEDIFFLPLPPELLEPEQKEHQDSCGPYACGLEIWDQNTIKLELLVRARNKLRCSCVAYATPRQREYVINYVDTLIKELDIPV
ncbi:MAG: hypothetical protein JW718_06695 [Desulfovibrionaceae bacterium]|nr:hypothetical protein [Desulfovibrionaceae bacterium]